MINRGSEWHKWDLHVHTPKSIVNNYGGDTDEIWEKFISALENLPTDVKVLGITDYYFIDGYEKVMEYRTKGRLKNIEKIFPILEFRIDTFGCGSQNNLQKINQSIYLPQYLPFDYKSPPRSSQPTAFEKSQDIPCFFRCHMVY